MKNSMTGVLISVLVSVMISFFLWNLIAATAQDSFRKLEAQLVTLEAENLQAQATYETLKKEQKTILDDPQKMWLLTRRLLKPGFEEAALMKMITDCTYDCSDGFIIKSFDVYKPYFIEEKSEENKPRCCRLKMLNWTNLECPLGLRLTTGVGKAPK